MKEISLNGIWKLYYRKDEGLPADAVIADLSSAIQHQIDARVPGNVELDLSAAGILPADLFYGENIKRAQDFEQYEWFYETQFETPKIDSGRIVLHFAGVDTLADYYLNCTHIGSSQNMLIPAAFDITGLLSHSRVNTLVVHIHSVMRAAYCSDVPAYCLQNTWHQNPESVMIRKAPHMFGWDIMPRAVSAGIDKPVCLQLHDTYELTAFTYQLLSLSGDAAVLRFTFDSTLDAAAIAASAYIEISGHCTDSSFDKTERLYFKAGTVDIPIDHPYLWWPRGYGAANLYTVTAALRYGNGCRSAQRSMRIGIRQAKLVRTDLTDGRSGTFTFVINDTAVFCRGTNWVALDAFHSRDAERYPHALALLKDIGCNMVRCWGGSVYPDDCFYDFCDENGIMVWQDFSMACHAYPQTDAFLHQIRAEAEAVVRRLRHHASLVLWAGDNECDQLLYSSGSDPGANAITRRVLPDVVQTLDAGRSYLPSSPYIAPSLYERGSLDAIPEDHLWGPRDYFKSAFYTGSKAHFVSEIGYHGCPSRRSIERFISPDALWPCTNNSQWNLHSSDQRDRDTRVMLMTKQIQQFFGSVPDTLDEFSLASQIVQAEAKKFFIEHARSNSPVKSGILWWNLLDGWPQMSDAVVDYYFEKKLAYHYIRRVQAPFLILMDEPEAWNCAVIASNQTMQGRSGVCTITDLDSGSICFRGSFQIEPNSTKPIGAVPVFYSEQRMLLIEWQTQYESGINHYLCGSPAFCLAQYKDYLTRLKFTDEAGTAPSSAGLSDI